MKKLVLSLCCFFAVGCLLQAVDLNKENRDPEICGVYRQPVAKDRR